MLCGDRLRHRERGCILWRRSRAADSSALAAAELAVVFGSIVLVTGPLWARKAWGVWWVWEARLTITLVMWMVFVAYLLLRRFGGPGSEVLAAAVGLFGMVLVPFVYWSVNSGARCIRRRTWCRRCRADDAPVSVVSRGVPRALSGSRCWLARAARDVSARRSTQAYHRAGGLTMRQRVIRWITRTDCRASHRSSCGVRRSRPRSKAHQTSSCPGQGRGRKRCRRRRSSSRRTRSSGSSLLAYVFVLWRRLGARRARTRRRQCSNGKLRATVIAHMPASHFIFIPAVLLVGHRDRLDSRIARREGRVRGGAEAREAKAGKPVSRAPGQSGHGGP